VELSHEVVEVLSARIVCSAANNQLAHDGIEKRLAERDTTYAPDYCVNSGRAPLSERVLHRLKPPWQGALASFPANRPWRHRKEIPCGTTRAAPALSPTRSSSFR